MKKKTQYRRPLNDRLADREPRSLDVGADPLTPRSSSTVRLDRPDEVAAAVVGAMILQKAREYGQTRVFERAIESIIDKATGPLTPEEVMRLEVEAYGILDWLVGGEPADDEALAAIASRADGVIVYDPHAPFADIIRRAISEEFDLKIDYFSKQRGQMNTRRITPYSVDAETYVSAYCHARRAERVFRLNRITRCIPVHGRPLSGPIRAKSSKEDADDEDAPRQISLLDE